jgi:hypothetical protein
MFLLETKEGLATREAVPDIPLRNDIPRSSGRRSIAALDQILGSHKYVA